jgi:superfamily II RNA helicase
MNPLALHPFPYDPFQQRAIEVIERNASLIVSAPTGAGKTVLADYVIERSLAAHERVIYTAPIKALSNQKFRDFSNRHGEQVGILTGDVTINPSAPLIIMTTEIYRNTVLENPERLASYRWIIFDEIHYLDDPERGTVWEEAILFTPVHMAILALSATIPNMEELARWIRSLHDRPIEVIQESSRPVPLETLFQCHNRILPSLQDLKREGFQGAGAGAAARPHHHHRRFERWRGGGAPNRLEPLLRELVREARLPCIIFTFGRRRAEETAWELSRLLATPPAECAALRALFDSLAERFGIARDRSLQALLPLIDRGVGYHHAGMLPMTKEVVERLFASRLMKLIVTTETFALGINMPARSVVLDDVKKRSDTGFALLRRRDFLQMAGRAGRRGMDEAGFVYLRVNPRHVSFPEIQQLLHGPPEPVRSRFNMAYATLLNLSRRHGDRVTDIFPKTLYYLQTSGPLRARGLELIRYKLSLLGAMGYLVRTPDPSTLPRLTPKGEFASWIYGYELLLGELYGHGRLSPLDPVSLAVLIAAIVYEPRPRTPPPKPHRIAKRLSELCREPLARIHREETRCRIAPKTRAPAFHLAHAVEAWMARAPFERLARLCDADDGELVRYFRMTVQVLRQLAESPATDARLGAAAREAQQRINRDVVDAEAQLRLG